MARKPTYAELEQRVRELENETVRSKRAEEALRESETRLVDLAEQHKMILDALPQLISFIDADLIYRFVNRSYEKFFECKVEDIVGRSLPEVIGPAVWELAERHVRRALAGEVVEYNEVFEYPDKEPRHMMGYLLPHRGATGSVEGYFGVLNDITRLFAMQEALRESEETMRYIIKHDPNAIAVYDRNLRYIAVSDRYLQDYNVKEEDIIGRHHYEVFPEMPQRWKDVHQRCLAGAIERNDDDYFEHPDGSITYNRWECRPWYGADGEIGGMITYTEVTTERKKAEKALQESEERARRAAEVNRTMAEIGRIISSTLSIDEVYEQFAVEVKKIIPFDRITIGLINYEQGTYGITYISGIEVPEHHKGKIVPLPRITGEAMRKKSGIFLHEEHEKDFAEDYPEFLIAFRAGIRSIMAAPLISKNQVIGVLYLASRSSKVYTERDLRLAENVATQIGGAIASAQLYAQIKLAEEELKKSRDYLTKLHNSLADAVFTVKMPERKIESVNTAVSSLFGYTVQECVEKGTEMFYPDQTAYQDFGKQLVKAIEEGKEILHTQQVVRRKDGELFPAEMATTFLKEEGEVRAVITIVRDITERKRAEKALRESEERYRALFEYNPIGTIIVDNEARIVMYNFAKEKSEGEGRLPNIGDVMYKDYAGKHQINMHEELMKCIRSGDRKEFTELKYKDQFLHIRISPFSGGAIITSIDITAMKKLHDQLQQSEKMEAIGTLAGGIAHEFNNILAIIIGNTELAIDDVPEWNPAKECLKEIRFASMRAKDMVRQILSFARKSLIARKPVRVSPIIEETLKLMRASIPTTIDIRHEISCERDTVLADLTQLNQILMNLCTNAGHAMRKEGGVLEVSLENVEFGMRDAELGLEPGTYVKLTVRDTGHGIDPEIMDRIFEPYFTTKGQGEGTGMGLAVVHGIVKSYDGAITVQSEVGKGTVFEVLIPVIEAEVLKEIEKEDELPTGDECILFVDDEEALLRAYTLALTSLGYEVVSFNNPLEALEAFQKDPEKFDLIITDLTMPHITGDKLAKEMMEIRSDIPVILCSGYDEPLSGDKVSKLGIKAYVTKPFIKGDLARVVRRALADN